MLCSCLIEVCRYSRVCLESLERVQLRKRSQRSITSKLRIHVLHEAGIILHPSFTSLLCILQELVRQELLDAPSLLGVLDEALLDEVSEGRAPFFRDARHRIVYHRVKQLLQILREIVERRLALRQFKCKAPERPDVHLGRISVALGDFRRNPT